MSEDEVRAAVAASPQQKKYGTAIDNESAREILTARLEGGAAAKEAEDKAAGQGTAGAESGSAGAESGAAGSADKVPFPEDPAPRSQSKAPEKKEEENLFSQVVNSSAFKQFTRTAAREIARGIFGTSRRRR